MQSHRRVVHCLGRLEGPGRPVMADCVEKLICVSERERLNQGQVPTRNNDSRTGPLRFFYCKFPLHRARSASFSTQSGVEPTSQLRCSAPSLAVERAEKGPDASP